jgi:hypothetical protein
MIELVAALPGSSGADFLAIGGILLSSGIGALVAFTVARRNAKVAANTYVSDNQRIVAEARARLIDQINDELVNIYMFELQIRKIFIILSATAAGAEPKGPLTEMISTISDMLGEAGPPPRIVNGRAADYGDNL